MTKNTVWEIIGYVSLALAVIGQIIVGYTYLIAQGIFLGSNVASVVRDYAIDLPMANKIKDMVFTGITIGLIIVRMTIN